MPCRMAALATAPRHLTPSTAGRAPAPSAVARCRPQGKGRKTRENAGFRFRTRTRPKTKPLHPGGVKPMADRRKEANDFKFSIMGILAGKCVRQLRAGKYIRHLRPCAPLPSRRAETAVYTVRAVRRLSRTGAAGGPEPRTGARPPGCC